MFVLLDANWWQVITQIESDFNWVYDAASKRFVYPQATHSVDDPDSSGRARSVERVGLDSRAVASVRFRFVSASGGFDYDSLQGAGQWIEFSASMPAGVHGSFSSQRERGFFTGVQAIDAGSAVLPTTREVVSGGITFDGLVGLLPGGRARVDALLVVSSFVSDGLDRAVVRVPIQVDGRRREWVRVFDLASSDANARLAFSDLGLRFSVGGSRVYVLVRVD